MEQYLREWREDAARKSQHEAAIFVGDKVLALTSMDSSFRGGMSVFLTDMRERR